VFIKEGITCKTRPEQELIRQCYFTIKLVTYSVFKTKLLPPILKSMLRNPEVILECIATVISNVSLDLSADAVELTKGFSGKSFSLKIVYNYLIVNLLCLANLYSQNERPRVESSDLCKQLALKCSDATVVSNILKLFFNIYHGSEGKLSTSEQKINVLQVSNFKKYLFLLLIIN